MKKILLFSIVLFLSFQNQAQDTFSIIAADPETLEIGAAGATCVDGIAQWGGIQLLNFIIPARGGVNAQAYICLNPHINLDNSIEQMANGLSPQEIIDWLMNNDECNSQNFNPAYRQYGIVDFDSQMNIRVAAHTGANTDDFKGHIIGPNYSIQGNILLGQEVLDGMEAGFNNTEGTLAQKLMGAMQGANIPGADQRCLARGTSSTSAFLRVVKPFDIVGSPSLDLGMLEMPFGEEPIDSLQTLFDAYLATTSTNDLATTTIEILPNPASNTIQFKADQNLNINQIIFYNSQGQIVSSQNNPNLASDIIDISNFAKGIYFVAFQTKEKQSVVKRFIKM